MINIPIFITFSFCILCFIYLSILISLGIKNKPKIIQNKKEDITVIVLFPYRTFRKGLFYLLLILFIILGLITANYYWNFQISYKNNSFLIITLLLLFLAQLVYKSWMSKENNLRQLIIYKDKIRYAYLKKNHRDIIFPYSIFRSIRKKKLGYKEIHFNSIDNIFLEKRKFSSNIKSNHSDIIVTLNNEKGDKISLPLFLFNSTQYQFVFFLFLQKLEAYKKTQQKDIN